MTALVPVCLGDRSYNIHVGAGLIQQLGTLMKPVLARDFAVIVTDENVAPLHLEAAQTALAEAGVRTEAIILPAGERTKCFAELENLTGQLLDLGVERDDTVIALGGGVIGDLTGFAASILRRGVRFAQVPTTLLAQVDSSVGGKTAINVSQGKNLIGAFYQPQIVIADVGVLETLPRRELLAGYAEVVKYGALGDADFFDWLEVNGPALLGTGAEALAMRTEAVARSCATKAKIVAEDERESGVRALLNLGHTFGHALEAATGYSDKLIHGEGVALGMGLAFDLSSKLGFTSGQDGARLRAHLEAVGLKAHLAALDDRFSVDELMGHMAQDKKVSAGQMNLVLARKIGDAFVERGVDETAIRSVWEANGAS